jgi:hypothetical protein
MSRWRCSAFKALVAFIILAPLGMNVLTAWPMDMYLTAEDWLPKSNKHRQTARMYRVFIGVPPDPVFSTSRSRPEAQGTETGKPGATGCIRSPEWAQRLPDHLARLGGNCLQQHDYQ